MPSPISPPVKTVDAPMSDAAGSSGPFAVTSMPRMTFLRGRDAILPLASVLTRLAAHSGQTGEADSLLYYLSTPEALKRRPMLVLVGSEQVLPDAITGDGTVAAALLFEVMAIPRLAGARIFGTTDGTGRRNLLAPRGQRARMAALITAALIQRGAQMAQIDYNEDHMDTDFHPTTKARMEPYQSPPEAVERRRTVVAQTVAGLASRLPQGQWSLVEREKIHYLPLLASLDETLARIGQKTRANLRYYRRRAESELGCVFLADVEISRADFMVFSRQGFSPVSDAVASARYDLLNILPNGYLYGLCDRNGKWLSMVRGRIQNNFLEIDWLINRADMPESSIGTVVRSYLLEHAIGLGCTRMYIEGGTAMPLKHSFIRGAVSEMTLRRSSAYMKLLETLSRTKPFRHHIAETLRSDGLRWNRW